MCVGVMFQISLNKIKKSTIMPIALDSAAGMCSVVQLGVAWSSDRRYDA